MIYVYIYTDHIHINHMPGHLGPVTCLLVGLGTLDESASNLSMLSFAQVFRGPKDLERYRKYDKQCLYWRNSHLLKSTL